MYILGISDSHCATAALLKDGKIIACASEERFTRIKTQSGIPIKSINYCLSVAQIDPSELDFIAFAGEFNSPVVTTSTQHRASRIAQLYHFGRHHFYKLFEYGLEYNFPKLRVLNQFIYNFFALLFKPKLRRARMSLICKLLGVSQKKVLFVDHHLCHAYAALYSSPFPSQHKQALVFTADGQGDRVSATVNIFKNGSFQRISQSSSTDSLGALYAEVTMFLGMKLGEDEYKVMGLAAYGKPKDIRKAYDVLRQLIWVDKKTLTFKTAMNSELFGLYLQKRLVRIRFDCVAGAIQQLTEDLLVEWVHEASKRYKVHTIVCGGGVFMNVKANKRLLELPDIKEMFIMPSSGDESNAIGVAYWTYINKHLDSKNVPEPIQNLYLGPEYANNFVSNVLKRLPTKKYIISQEPRIGEKIVDLLLSGEAVAIFEERMEWGARALGHRSILADASNVRNIETLNKMIKGRDFWMPFAPVILDTWETKYIHNPKQFKSYFMNMAFDSKSVAREHLAAAIHPYDGTLRPQILDQRTNPFLYKILKVYERKTKRGGLLNTSFNLHGEPIVCAPEDALSTLKRSGLKYLVINDFLIRKV